jgi:hypothetical protein
VSDVGHWKAASFTPAVEVDVGEGVVEGVGVGVRPIGFPPPPPPPPLHADTNEATSKRASGRDTFFKRDHRMVRR